MKFIFVPPSTALDPTVRFFENLARVCGAEGYRGCRGWRDMHGSSCPCTDGSKCDPSGLESGSQPGNPPTLGIDGALSDNPGRKEDGPISQALPLATGCKADRYSRLSEISAGPGLLDQETLDSLKQFLLPRQPDSTQGQG